MHNAIDIPIGTRFGRLVVIEQAPSRRGWCRLWNCVCDCGERVTAQSKKLRNGSKVSCGCLWKEERKNCQIQRALNRPRAFRSWRAMKSRCLYKSATDYPQYGGAGITICQRWMNFKNFFSDMGECPADHTLDRINGKGNYEPGNCRWADRKTQSNNRAHIVMLTLDGKTQCMKDWSREANVNYGFLQRQLKKGIPLREIVASSSNYQTSAQGVGA